MKYNNKMFRLETFYIAIIVSLRNIVNDYLFTFGTFLQRI
jgi:hypothetical protein